MPSLEDFQNGLIILIDKPLQWTSFDVVNFIRANISKKFRQRLKVGHAGTLDPLASGLLIVCTGRMTKQIDRIQAMTKTYSGSFIFGAETPSFDRETEPDKHFPTHDMDADKIQEHAQQFVGKIMQLPPAYSAIKVDGKRAYAAARKQKEVKLSPREVEIYGITTDARQFPVVGFEVSCSKGTYIRALARDLGRSMQNGAYLGSLKRTAIGDFHVDDALSPEAWKTLFWADKQ